MFKIIFIQAFLLFQKQQFFLGVSFFYNSTLSPLHGNYNTEKLH